MPDTYTPEQYAGVLDVLGLDPDTTLSVTLSPRRVHVLAVECDDTGAAVLDLGVPRRMEYSIPITVAPAAPA